MEISELSKYRKNSIERDIQNYLRKAYQTAICSNGPYSNPDYHEAVWKEFNSLADKIFNKKIKNR